VNVFDFDIGIFVKVFEKFGYKNIHAANCKITLITPDFLNCSSPWPQFFLILHYGFAKSFF